MAEAWLTAREAAQHLGCSARTVLRRVEEWGLPAVRVGHIVRVEARAVLAEAPGPADALRAVVSLPDLARHWRVSEQSLRRLARRGGLPFLRRHPWGWTGTRKALLAWTASTRSRRE